MSASGALKSGTVGEHRTVAVWLGGDDRFNNKEVEVEAECLEMPFYEELWEQRRGCFKITRSNKTDGLQKNKQNCVFTLFLTRKHRMPRRANLSKSFIIVKDKSVKFERD